MKENIIELHGTGTKLVNIPMTASPTRKDTRSAKAVQTEEYKGIQTLPHALTNIQASLTARSGIVFLAHIPTALGCKLRYHNGRTKR